MLYGWTRCHDMAILHGMTTPYYIRRLARPVTASMRLQSARRSIGRSAGRSIGRLANAAVFLLIVLFSITPAAADPVRTAIGAINADILFMRHALAPGTGDPAHFRIDDCTTQRNLDERGRAQARNIGAYFRTHGIAPDIILSSQWCRCRDTATEMDIGAAQPFSGLNSFFDGHVDRGETLAMLRARMKRIEPGQLVLMVTHQVVISAITGIAPRSGGIIAYNSRTNTARRVDLP